MRWRNTGRRVNAAVENLASRVDGQTRDVAGPAARVVTLAVRLLRWPSLFVLVAGWPFLAGLAVISLLADDTWLQTVAGALAFVGALVSAGFWWRRRHLLLAVEDEQRLATEMGIAVALSDDVTEAREALGELAGAGGGVRVFSRLRGLRRGFGVAPGVFRAVDDLPRARWFFPPKVGTTVTLFLGALALVPVAFVACLLLGIALAAR